MKELSTFCRANFFLAVCCLFFSLPSFSQASRRTQTAHSTTIDAYCNGFYISLPPDYVSGKKYPLLVFLHGQGEIGDGSAGALPAVLRNGPPKLINQGIFPDPVTVGENSFEFIVISPQLNTWPNPPYQQQAVNDVINYARDNYQVDTTRMYLTGLSMGGGIAWEYAGWPNYDYAKRLAGLLVIAGASYPDQERAAQIAKFHLPVWATANQDDPTVPSWYTTDYVQYLNDVGADPSPLINIFDASGHGGWDVTYSTLTQNGLSVYQWMLQYQRVGDGVVTNAPLPVVFSDFKAVLTPPAAVTINWSTASEENNKYFIVQRSADGSLFNDLDTVAAYNQPHAYNMVDNNPLPGNNFYRVAQIDLDGKSSFTSVAAVSVPSAGQAEFKVSPNPTSGTVYLQVEGPEQGPLEVSLSDVQGKLLHSWSFQKNSLRWTQLIDLANFPGGNYFITVRGNKLKEVRQVMKK